MSQLILSVALPVRLRQLFDYHAPQGIDKSLKKGMRVLVPFQKRTLVGVIMEVKKTSTLPYDKIKSAIDILDDEVLIPSDLLQLCQWAADYYHHSLGEVLMHVFPTALRKAKHSDQVAKKLPVTQTHPAEITLNDAQQHAVTTIINEEKFRVFAINGVTGSGKTEVYLRVIDAVLKQNKQALVLIPEISLTPQTIARFTERFNCGVVSMHSGMTEKKRYEAWLAARFGEARIVIGTRSAIFTPMPNLGVIVIDEEHDLSFKQQDRFRYHARDLAVMRSQLNGIPIVLGSATLSLETLHNIKRTRYHCIDLPERAGNAQMPHYEVLDLRQNQSHDEGLSLHLLDAIKQQLAQDNQVMLFLNKRGFAPTLFCTSCNWIADCKHCATHLVYHQRPKSLRCHCCDSRSFIPNSCPTCHAQTLIPLGLGTQKVEEMLGNFFPDTPIVRIDRDSTRRKGSLNTLLDQVHSQQKLILLGTQMIAKGHHFPNVTLVGIIDADGGLFSADFRSQEQLGQLILQVAGRSGRALKEGKVLIQTRNPENQLLKTLLVEGYQAYAEILLQERQNVLLPPYAYLAIIRAEARNETVAKEFLTTLKSQHDTIETKILGPIPALLAKRKGYYCQHLLFKSSQRKTLHASINQILSTIDAMKSVRVKWVLDVDPMSV